MLTTVCYYCNTPFGKRYHDRCRTCRRRVIVENRYLLDKLISSGGFGKVFFAHDLKTGATVAIKLVIAQTDLDDRLIRNEIQTISERLSGLQFVPKFYGAYQYESDTFNGSEIYIVMEYIFGNTLDEVRRLPWASQSVTRFLNEMLNQLHICHERGVVHRDLKPKNIIRTKTHDYMLIDFGIAKLDTTTGTVAHGFGTVTYAPIEQIKEQTTNPQTDLYSLGVVAYELLTNTLPPKAEDRVAGASLLPPSVLVENVPQYLEQWYGLFSDVAS